MAPTEHPRGPSHEASDVRAKGVLSFLIGLAAAAIVVSVGIWAVFHLLARAARSEDRPLAPNVAKSMARLPPYPRLEARPLAPRARLNANEKARLSGYGWVDRNAGTVHIPIDRAMDLIVERGLPLTRPAAASQAAPPAPVRSPTSAPVPRAIPAGGGA